MFKTIVVGTDGSETAARAVQTAAEIAGASGDSVLHIVSVAKPVSQTAVGLAQSAPAGTGVMQAQLEDDAVKGVQELLKRAADAVAGIAPTVETYARFGSPAEVLCELSDQVRADLLVVGNRGMTGGRRFLGSVPNTVSHHAPCSVLIAHTA